jgi:hypothetical protein
MLASRFWPRAAFSTQSPSFPSSSSSSSIFDAVVVGGGVAGNAMACALGTYHAYII